MATATAVRARRAPAPARPTAPRRAPLVVVQRAARRPRLSTRRIVAMALCFLVGSMLLVGVAQAYLTQGQVRLARIEQQLNDAQARNHDLQLQVAQLEDPARVIGKAQAQGLNAPSQVTALPLVGSTGAGSAVQGR